MERALSILQGRHPDAVRAERETMATIATKKAVGDALAERAATEERRRWIARGVVTVGVLTSAVVGFASYSSRTQRGRAVDAALAPVMAPYLARGFRRRAPSRFAAERLEVDVTEPTCFVAFAPTSPGDGELRVDRPPGALDASGSVAWCTCGAEHSTVALKDPSSGGVAVLEVLAPEVGGDQGLFFLSPRPQVIAPPDECSHESLDAWIDKGTEVRPKDEALALPTRQALHELGFAAAGSAPASLPFAIVPGAAETCSLAFSTSPDDTLSLRRPGGERPVVDVKGPLGFCGSKAQSLTVWRKGTGEVVVERAPANRIGGTQGVREAASRLGLPAVEVWVADDDLGWDATAMLRASGVAPPEITVATDGRAVTRSRLMALSIDGAMLRADAPQGTEYVCDPPLTRDSHGAYCVQSSPLAWQVVGGAGKAGIAAATFPFWMQAFSGVADATALGAELALVKLGRRLAAEGFEATTLEGVTEVDGGARVTGRAGDDAVVAVQLTREAPWASPCGTDAAWSLNDNPAIVPLSAGAEITLACLPGAKVAKDRRTVVFRRASQAETPK